MSKFNTVGKAPTGVNPTPETYTYEGSQAFKQTSTLELYQTVVTSLFGEGKFYESANDVATRITELVHECVKQGDAEFVAKLAIYTRTDMYIRSMPIFLTVTLAKALREVKGSEFKNIRGLVGRVIQRADEIREMFAAAQFVFGTDDPKAFKRNCPRAIFKGISDAMNKFNAYHFKKYSGGNGAVKFTDVMRVVHPKPKDDAQSDIYKMIMEDTLPAINTWETTSAEVGQGEYESEDAKNAARKVMWQEHADSKEQGYMSKMRNLANYIRHGVDTTKAIEHLTNEKAVANSKQLPFRFYTAYKQLGGKTLNRCSYWGGSNTTVDVNGTPEVLTALEDAFDLAVKNLPDLGDDVLIVVDQSGSMSTPISNNSTVSCNEIAAVLGAAVWYNQVVVHGKRAMVAGFACKSKIYNWSKRTSALAAAKEMMNTNLGVSTHIESAWNAAKKDKLTPSTIIILSDMQMTGSRYDRIMVPEKFGLADNDTLKVSINLAGYANTPFATNNGWMQLSGWSEKLFDLMTAMRNPSDAIKIIGSNIDI